MLSSVDVCTCACTCVHVGIWSKVVDVLPQSLFTFVFRDRVPMNLKLIRCAELADPYWGYRHTYHLAWVFSVSSGDWTQVSIHAWQALYLLSCLPRDTQEFSSPLLPCCFSTEPIGWLLQVSINEAHRVFGLSHQSLYMVFDAWLPSCSSSALYLLLNKWSVLFN